MRRLIDIVFVIAVALVIVAPGLQTRFHLLPSVRIDERREPHPLPDFRHRFLKLDVTLADGMNAWFDDRLGFRELLIRTKNEIDYQVFGTAGKVIVGRDGWLFDIDPYEMMLDEEIHGDELLQPILASMVTLDRCLARKGVKLVTVINPTKSDTYSEFLPWFAVQEGTFRFPSRVIAALKKYPDLIVVDGVTIARAHKSEQLFHKTDVHTNLKGASLVYLEMLRRIAAENHRPMPDVVAPKWTHGSMAIGSGGRFMTKLLPITETTWAPSNGVHWYADDETGHWGRDVGAADLPEAPDLPLFDWTYERTDRDPTLLPATVIYGTSFAIPIFALRYHEAFAKTYYTKGNFPRRIEPILERMPPDVKILVMEWPEYYLRRIAELSLYPACRGVSSDLPAPSQ